MAEDVPIEKLDLVEAHYIDMYNSNNPEVGYNISSGHSDNSMVDEYRDIQPEENYETSSRINTSDISNEVNGEKLFMVLYSINPKLSLRYFNKEIIIKLNLINLDKHYVYYLVPVLEEIINEVE